MHDFWRELYVQGAIIGLVTSLSFSLWISIGQILDGPDNIPIMPLGMTSVYLFATGQLL